MGCRCDVIRGGGEPTKEVTEGVMVSLWEGKSVNTSSALVCGLIGFLSVRFQVSEWYP